MVAAFLPGNPDHTQFPLKLWKTKISKQYHSLGLSLSTDEPTIPHQNRMQQVIPLCARRSLVT